MCIQAHHLPLYFMHRIHSVVLGGGGDGSTASLRSTVSKKARAIKHMVDDFLKEVCTRNGFLLHVNSCTKLPVRTAVDFKVNILQ